MRRHPARHTRLWWEIGLTIAVVVIMAGVLVVRGLSTHQLIPGSPSAAPRPASSAPSPTPAPPATTGPVLAVKVDNVRAARPATGLASASVVYVEPVEGGLTRLVAVYMGPPPPVIGPVRSARRTDIGLLGQYGTPVLAYSGAAPELLPALRAANLVNASPSEAPGAYYRDGDRAAPHNLFLRTGRLPGGARAPDEPALLFGAAPGSGVSVARFDIAFPSAGFGFVWSPANGQWLISMDGLPFVSSESGRLSAATVVVQRVSTGTSEVPEDARGQPSPVADTIGRGTATILRDGLRIDATWTRPAVSAPTRFHTAAGEPVPLAAGPVWILLVPA